jgi:NADH-ubiquinone oxidoreductase chain 5
MFFLFASFTKRAQFPFSGWLPKAIRAPTPVRSLVHRSTLVTAGVFLIIGFVILNDVSFFRNIFLSFGLLTMCFSNLLALFEKDIKKVIALRTLSQIGFCVFSLGLGFLFLTYFHILRHAFFKSCLFMQVGFIIYFFFGQQDVRGYSFYC